MSMCQQYIMPVQVFATAMEQFDTAYSCIDAEAVAQRLRDSVNDHCILVFLGCGCAASEIGVLDALLQLWKKIQVAVFMDVNVRSTTMHNIQEFMSRTAHIQCFISTSFYDLTRFLRDHKEDALVCGIQADFSLRTAHAEGEFIEFLDMCESGRVQPYFPNFQATAPNQAGNHEVCANNTGVVTWVHTMSWSTLKHQVLDHQRHRCASPEDRFHSRKLRMGQPPRRLRGIHRE